MAAVVKRLKNWTLNSEISYNCFQLVPFKNKDTNKNKKRRKKKTDRVQFNSLLTISLKLEMSLEKLDRRGLIFIIVCSKIRNIRFIF